MPGESAGGSAGEGGGAAGNAGEAGASGLICDPIAQSGCLANERCTSVKMGTDPSEVRCLPDATQDLGAPCSFVAEGFDNCKAGTICGGGVCETICDLALAQACGGSQVCVAFADLFSGANGQAFAGACQPSCNPVTQERSTDGALACGSADPNAPARGCYGTPEGQFLCASAGAAANTSDVAPPDPVFINSCAPGFSPLLHAFTGSTMPICVAYCLPSDSSSVNPGGATGAPNSGYSCPDRGAGGTHECRYLWFLQQQPSALGNTIGYCFDYTHYQYDGDGNGLPDTTYPSCTTLSPTAHAFDPALSDSQYWGCMAHP